MNILKLEKIVTKIGSGEVPTDPMPMEASDMMVILKPKKNGHQRIHLMTWQQRWVNLTAVPGIYSRIPISRSDEGSMSL